MFTLVENPTFTHTVEVTTPTDGGFRTDTFKATYKVLSVEDLAKHPVSATFSQDNAAFLRLVITGLEDIVGEDDKPLPYNDKLRDQVLGNPNAQMALMQSYLNALSGIKAGN